MKRYDAEKMAAKSRYQNYLPTLSENIRKEICQRMEEIFIEEKEYCDRRNYKHMTQIAVSIALYEVLQKHG